MACLSFFGMAAAGLLGGGLNASGQITEVVEHLENAAAKKIVQIDVKGVLMDGDGPGLARGVAQSATRMLKQSLKDPRVAGVLLVLDTPGGSVTASDIMYDYLQRLRKAGKPVVVLMGDLCASGGYYVAAGADAIYAHPTTVTGSIGVMINSISVHDLMNRYGVQDQSIVSGANKQILSMTKHLTDEQKALLQSIVDELYMRFVNIIAQGRKLEVNAVKSVADGRIMTAQTALKNGLVDAIGYREDAMKKLETLAGVGPFNVIRYGQPSSVWDVLSGMVKQPAQSRALLPALGYEGRALYLHGGLQTLIGVSH
ncbi:MAG: signal peptide peptidase SppA [Myxococcota bacterium]|nr:signal peptide peptidase SppA [Myxococcota bacterium]